MGSIEDVWYHYHDGGVIVRNIMALSWRDAKAGQGKWRDHVITRDRFREFWARYSYSTNKTKIKINKQIKIA